MGRIIRKDTVDCAEHFSLNAQQARVLKLVGSNCVINAGAGTGKTKTLTAAYIDALLNHTFEDGTPLLPSNIVAITYTNAAADELRARIIAGLQSLGRSDVAEHMDDSWIMTINAFCNKVLNNERMTVARHYGIDTSFYTLDDLQARQLQDDVARRVVAEAYSALEQREREGRGPFDIVTQEDVIDSLKAAAQKARVRGIERGAISAHTLILNELGLSFEKTFLATNIFFAQTLCDFLDAYQAAKTEMGAFDFTDQILYTQRLFNDFPEIAQRYIRQFGVILIDEFQDTNFIQYGIFKRLSSDNIIVVGDKRQSIYAFQGATVEVFDSVLHEKDPVTDKQAFREVKLHTNYRSHPEILEAVNALFESEYLFGGDFVRLLPPDPLTSQRGEVDEDEREALSGDDRSSLGARVKMMAVVAEKSNRKIQPTASEVIANEFISLLNRGGYKLRDLVVLASTRSQLLDCAEVLKSRGLSATVIGGADLLKDDYVLGLLRVLRALDNPLDDKAFVEAALSSYGRVSDEDLAELAKAARDHNRAKNEGERDIALYKVSEALAQAHPQSSIGRFVELFELVYKRYNIAPLAESARYVFAASGVADYLRRQASSQRNRRLGESYENVLEFIDLLDELQSAGEGNRACLFKIEELLVAGEDFEGGEIPASFSMEDSAHDAIRLMTIHKAKGLQFPVCAVLCYESKGGSRDAHKFTTFTERGDSDTNVMTVSLARYPLDVDEAAELERFKDRNHLSKADLGWNTDNTIDSWLKVIEMRDRNRIESDEGIRKYYVACTRAEERLIVVYAGKLPKVERETLDARQRVVHALKELKKRTEITVEYGSVDTPEKSKSGKVSDFVLDDMLGGPQEAPFKPVLEGPSDFAQLPTPVTAEQTRFTLSEITATGIEKYHSCPRNFYFATLLRVGLIATTNAAIQRGTAMHTALESIANDSLRAGSSNADELLSSGLAEKIKRLYGLEHDDVTKVMNDVRTVIQSRWWAELAQCETVKTEVQFYEKLATPAGEPYFLHGYIDICGRREDGSWLALDYKSGEREASRESYETQARCYALALLRSGAPTVDITFVRPEVKGEDDEMEAFSFHFEAQEAPEIETFLAASKEAMENAARVTDDELPAFVKREYCMRYCPYLGELCRGVK